MAPSALESVPKSKIPTYVEKFERMARALAKSRSQNEGAAISLFAGTPFTNNAGLERARKSLWDALIAP